jgi:probable HAF family extracellular repeat protein
MNFRKHTRIAVLGLFMPLLLVQGAAAQPRPDGQARNGAHHHYQMIDLGTFGGPTSSVTGEPTQKVINNAGVIVGGSDTALPTPEPDCYNPIFKPDCFIIHAFAWRAGHLKDLGTLPGGNYSFALEINERGRIVGASETDRIDPATGEPEFHAVLWENDRILDLGSLGGTASFAEVLNNHGQVVGNSLNGVPDPLSIMGLGGNLTLTQTHGFIWQDGKMRDLGTLGGPDSWANFINERGQVAGAAYTSDVIDPSTGTPQIDLFIWEDGRMKDLGNLGGNSGSTVGAPGVVSGINNRGEITGQMAPLGDQVFQAFLWNGHELLNLGTLGGNFSSAQAINDAGEVVGYADITGPNGYHHGFLWRGGEMIDLGTLGSDTCSDALDLNSRSQVVGASQSAAGLCGPWTTAFLWEHGGPMLDLNSLVSSEPGVHLVAAEAINEKGEIVAAGAPPGCPVGNSDSCQHMYALIPCDDDHPGVDGCDYSFVDAELLFDARSTTSNLLPAATRNEAKSSPAEAQARILSMIRAHRRFGALPH